MDKKQLSRRGFLRLSAMAAVGALAASCAKPAAEPATTKPTETAKAPVAAQATVQPTVPAKPKYSEAPVLAELVKAGKLPPLEDRLPSEPLVLKPLEKVGKYGGTLRSLGTDTGPYNITDSAYETTLRWTVDAQQIEPNIAKAWEVSSDGKVYTLFLRKGMKYHDGAPFTADDIMFYLEDVLGNKELSPTFPTWLALGGTPVQATKVDDYTVKLTFAAPHGFLPNYFAMGGDFFRPGHYLKQFHVKYAAKADLDKKIADAKFETWVQLFGNRNNSSGTNPDYPTVKAWYSTTAAPAERFAFKRNPYYWKVDPEGQQLPYIDECLSVMFTDAEVMKLQVLAGQADLQQKRMAFDLYPVLKENEAKGGYRTLLWYNPRGACPAIMPNQTCKDPVMRQLIRDDRFRIALSVAINRSQANEMVFHGQGEPRAATVATKSPIFKPEFATLHAEYDPAQANRLLDELGLTNRDKDGIRLRSDGAPLSIIIENNGEEAADVKQFELVKQYWEAVGVKTDVLLEAREQFRNRNASGEMTFGSWQLDYVYFPFQPNLSVPWTNDGGYWAGGFGLWYTTGGKSGEEPTGDIRKLQLIWDELQTVTDRNRQIEMFQEIFALHSQHTWLIGIVGHVPLPIVANAKLRNIPETAICSWTEMQYLGPARMEQLYYE